MVLQHLWYCSCVLLWAALLCLPPASSSSLLAEQWQCRLHSLSGPAIGKGRDCRQPLLAGGTPSSPCKAAKHGAPVGLGGGMLLEKGALHPQEFWGWGGSHYLCGIHNGVKSPRTDPGSKDQIKLEAGDKGCTSREWETPITQSSSKVLLISLYLVNLFFFFFISLFVLIDAM